jgi:tRNA A58 N-methylase Trm61
MRMSPRLSAVPYAPLPLRLAPAWRACGLVLALATRLSAQPAPDESERILQALALATGMSVADVGAGEGGFTVALARKVGAEGRVFATEVDRAELDKVEARVTAEGLANVTAVLGDQQVTGLPAACCDAILLRLVYHHFTDPTAMRRSLWQALRPGGRIAVIDVPPQPGWRKLEGVPERGGHGIRLEELVADMRGEGFEQVARHDRWPAEDDSYCVVFRRPGAPLANRRAVGGGFRESDRRRLGAHRRVAEGGTSR